jgi:hypothetical protein
VARAIIEIVETPFGERPFRVHVDPSDKARLAPGKTIDQFARVSQAIKRTKRPNLASSALWAVVALLPEVIQP